ncbi:hypothetical protein [Micromonospora parva]|uniref:hypothetical protein n=1 Tax=Micromonospora parva TaxID=1464048 RepID=UPI00340DC7B3
MGTLSVVVSIQDVDVLSTIALALAVLAFAAQLIISLAQGMSGAQQIAQVERVNADTQSALAALRATSDALLSTQKEHFGQVLRAALAKAVPDAVEETLSDENSDGSNSPADIRNIAQLQESILARVDEALSRERATLLPERKGFTPPEITVPHPAYDILSNFPDEAAGRESATVFKRLSPWEAYKFSELARGARLNARTGIDPGVWLVEGSSLANNSSMSGLIDKGLVRPEKRFDPTTRNPRIWIALTDTGLAVGRLVVPTGVPPAWLREVMSTPADDGQ